MAGVVGVYVACSLISFCCQAEDGIRGAQESRGLGDVYKRQEPVLKLGQLGAFDDSGIMPTSIVTNNNKKYLYYNLSLIHI